MKHLFILTSIALLTVTNTLSQNTLYLYEFSTDTTFNTENSKDILAAVAHEFETTSKKIVGNHQFEVSSTILISKSNFQQLLESLGYELVNFSKSVHLLNNEVKTDPGGVDCESASIVCSNDSFDGTATGYGVQELNGSNEGCLAGENQSSWYYLNIATGGDLTMTIDPVTDSDDYDFAIWGPYTDATAGENCPPITAPISCSFSAFGGNTGLAYTSEGTPSGCGLLGLSACPPGPVGDNSEDTSGDKWTLPLNTLAGEIYILCIDNFGSSGDPYGLTWGGSAVLDCTPVVLSVQVNEFYGVKSTDMNHLFWSTISESGNDFFTVEKSTDTMIWTVIDKQLGAGNSHDELMYSLIDNNISNQVNYYRLKQTDFDGETQIIKSISIDNTKSDKSIIQITNLMGQPVDFYFSGSRIIRYSDGTIVRKLGH